MTEPLLSIPSGGWTVDDLDAFPESHHRYELTDGALTVSPPPSSLHQAISARLLVRLEEAAPEPLAVSRRDGTGSRRATTPALYAQYGIPHYRRIELEPPMGEHAPHRARRLLPADRSGPTLSGERAVRPDIATAELLPRWAGRAEDPTVPRQGL